MQTTQALVCVLDEHGRIMLFNDACERATGFTRSEVLGRPLFESVIPLEEADAFREVLAFIWKTGHSSPQVGHWQTKDGGRRLIAWSNKPVSGADGVPAYLVTSGIDLTAHAAAAEIREPAMEGDTEAKLVEVGRLAQEQRALRRVATLVASEASPERVFTAVSGECARVLEVTASAVWRYEGDDTATVVGRHNRDGIDPFPLGTRLHADENTTVGRARDTGVPARVDDWGAATGDFAEMMLRSGYRSTVAAPIVVAGTPWGAVWIGSENRLSDDSEIRLGAFCELVSLAVASAQAREDLQSSRARIVRAGDEQRRKLERNLHDGAQQRLVSAALTLRVAQTRWNTDREAASQLLGVAADELECRSRGAARARTRAPSRRAHRTRPEWRARRPRGSAPVARAAGPRRGATRGSRRGHGVLHRLRGAHERRQARRGNVGDGQDRMRGRARQSRGAG